MSWTERLATRAGDAATRYVNSAIHGMPHGNKAEAEARNAHDRWIRDVRLGTPYFTRDAEFAYVGPDWDPQLTCIGGHIFTRSSGGLLYTDDKRSSWEIFWAAYPYGLTTNAPPMPKPPQGLGAGSEYAKAVSNGWTVKFH